MNAIVVKIGNVLAMKMVHAIAARTENVLVGKIAAAIVVKIRRNNEKIYGSKGGSLS